MEIKKMKMLEKGCIMENNGERKMEKYKILNWKDKEKPERESNGKEEERVVRLERGNVKKNM